MSWRASGRTVGGMNRAPTFITVLAASAAFAAPALAASGDLDKTFAAPDGSVVPPAGDVVTSIALQPDGKIVAALATRGGDQIAVGRYRADGTLDPTFAADGDQPGVARLDIAPSGRESAISVTVQDDGRIVAAGIAQNHLAVVRFNTDGTPDTTFNGGTNDSPPGSAVTVLPPGDEGIADVGVAPGGKILVTGRLTNGGETRLAVARYLTDGRLDAATFNDSSDASVPGTAVHALPGVTGGNVLGGAVRPDGSILAVGGGDADGHTHMLAIHVRAGGEIDQSFGELGTGVALYDAGDASLDDGLADVTLTPQGIVVAGAADIAPASASPLVGRLQADGKVDTSFGDGGFKLLPLDTAGAALAVTRQADGRLVVVGGGGDTFGAVDVRVTRLTSAGQLDASFGAGGSARRSFTTGADQAIAVASQPDGRIVIGGGSIFDQGSPLPLIARFEGDPPAAEPQPEQPQPEPGPQPAPAADTTAPVIGALSITRRRFKRTAGSALRFGLSEDATVRVRFVRRGKPAGAIERGLAAGKRRVTIGRGALKPARYRATVTAVDAAGNRSAPRRIRFRVVR
jgi:uncharacterized delta-60 repeat protein